ncbi:uncharacterized protein LOC131232338 [Magnolia sinica]|uniref:uncharacterized protein LOC131232338 n=1 Tax=Magnolia sinica TaxID=86752 RepID=UPI00265AEF74|nr:uncharacterized protein LOC131232338 [Magnolia sinica]
MRNPLPTSDPLVYACNCIQKIFSKILASRLSIILLTIISEEQSAFVKNRSIIESISIACEMANVIDRKSHSGNIILKLDMEKAYDRLEWPFISAVLGKFGFHQDWINIVRQSWEGSWFSILINGLPFGFFQSSRGLSSSIRALLTFILSYEQASGQRVNPSKSCFILPKKATPPKARQVARLSGFQPGSLPFTYLGVPLHKGRATLVKHVLASVPIHTLAATHVLVGVLKSLETRFVDFLWGWADGKKKLHWKKWRTITTPKPEGGLGIRNLSKVIKACRLKMAWIVKYKADKGLMRSPNTAWGTNIWNVKLLPKIPLLTWRIIRGALPVDAAIQTRGIQLASCYCYCVKGLQLT